MPSDRLFTLDEARALLPTVRRLLIELQAAKREFDAASAELEHLATLTGGNGHLANDLAQTRSKVETTGNALQRLLTELDEMGIELKGIEQGLIDFPSLREDRVVYLCYLLGEDDIAYWHDIDAGFAGRQPL